MIIPKTYCGEYINLISMKILAKFLNLKIKVTSLISQEKKNIKFTKNNKGKIRIVNSNYFMPGTYKSFEKYIPSKKEKLLEKKLHVINFKAYQFEGLSSDARKNIDSFDIYIKTFKID